MSSIADEDYSRSVTLETSFGDLTVELYYKDAPRACRNFMELSRGHHYDGVTFHRVIKNFLVQAGDLSGTGKGIKSIYGAKFEDEIKPQLNHTAAGILSMANTGPNTNGTQFFITLAPCPSLDGKHTIFGRVCRGMDTIVEIGNVPTDDNDRPLEDVMILGASVKDVIHEINVYP
ncbi:peptidyl-prolyl cis-trans isomerase CYP18-2 isoform X2 [Rosa chinensis]|uniref:peptidyl-prolyl cis-trans isomerase CYP18-2 isoform X2 n=1 Tax=Rosa chinensis TaxID=74649 RepID=UPI000D0972BF|nr:peptidyl-prolyl cis-trans isomerase CYP18-2 isoform X2 [Rosa chinensis]